MRSPRRALLLAASLLLIAASSIQAQSPAGLRLGITAPVVPSDDTPLLGMSRAEDQSHWKTGFIVGTVLGATAAIIYAGGHGNDKLTVREGVLSIGLGALLGGVPGALIGGLFPKRQNGE